VEAAFLQKGFAMHDLELIRPEAQHLPELGRICFEAFRHVSEGHGFERDFPDAETAAKIIGLILSLPGSFGVAARDGTRLVGSNFMMVTDGVGGVGPITVDPAYHGRGIGRRLMSAALEHARQQGLERVRLLQDSFNTTSLSLYASLGFEVREPVGVMSPPPVADVDATVRRAGPEDLPVLEELGVRFYKVSRRNELAAWLARGIPVLVREGQGRIRGYLVPGKLGHGVAETEADALALIGQIPRHALPGLSEFFCPLRNTSLYRALLRTGCRLSKVMTLMTIGPYEEPAPVWLPSIAY
jgi:ribosomal protein S18 acetylase RimI-like enzyme